MTDKTIEDLNRELIKKDNEIDFLKKRVKALDGIVALMRRDLLHARNYAVMIQHPDREALVNHIDDGLKRK